ncbi:GAF and ANTAR domain-containing protein [Actinoplanes sp. TRM88002]|uniref:GAF and ANTAR domain-containing protein n=1 Tax=Paractinoplanes hotanensis TaxID=2906497 RepID=A0ABT0Y6Q2_9ACTN|nr:GAF and ANTAR domain-containing protein [Actinoplanes hotanensis]MCM4081004.1 GAF and ANTAR domain-containing protein [Actinoplanes hotanensis]
MDEFIVRVTRLVADEPARPGDGHGVAGMLRRLCSAAERALSANGAGVSVLAAGGMRGVAAVSAPAYEPLEELQFSLGEGPCLDAFASRQPVLVPDLSDGAMGRWPGYAPALHDRGVRAVFAFPLQIGAARLGALDVFRDEVGSLTADEFRNALTFADIAVTTLLDGQARAAPGAAADGLDDEVVGQRAELFQAQGMVAVQLGVSLADALARLRAYAYAEDRALGEVARDVVARRVSFDSGQS